MSSKTKLEKFLTAWENDVDKMETSITSFKSEIQSIILKINDEIHDMQLNSMSGQLIERRLQKIMVDKIEDMEKVLEQQMSENGLKKIE